MVCQQFGRILIRNSILVHYYDEEEGKYNINFTITGFDRDPLTSLIVEAKKKEAVDKGAYESLNNSSLNYNKYAWSLLKDNFFLERHSAAMKAVSDINK